MSHVLDHYAEQNHGNVVEKEQLTPIANRSPREIIEINIFRGGEQTSQAGVTRTFNEQDLEQVCTTYNPGKHLAPLIRGHDEVDDGAPSMGWVQGVIRNGLDLIARVALTGFGQSQLEEGNFARVSCRFYPPDDPANPYPGNLALRHLALVTIPAIKGLAMFAEQVKDLQSPQELPEMPTTSWDFVYSESLSYSTIERMDNLEKNQAEVVFALRNAMKKYALDGEDDSNVSTVDPDVQEMDMGEVLTIKVLGDPKGKKKESGDPWLEEALQSDVDGKNEEDEDEDDEEKEEDEVEIQEILPECPIKDGGQLSVKNLMDDSAVPEDFMPELKTAIIEIEAVGESLPGTPLKMLPLGRLDSVESQPIIFEENEEAGTVHDSDPKRQREYDKILATYTKPHEEISGMSQSAKRNHLVDSLLKHFSNERAKERTPKLELSEPTSIKTTNAPPGDLFGLSYDQKKKVNDAARQARNRYKSETSNDRIEIDGKTGVKTKSTNVQIPTRRSSPLRLESQSYSESIAARLTKAEQEFQRRNWTDFAETFYQQGILVESIVSQEELIDALLFLDNQTSHLTFSEQQVNPLDTFKKVLTSLPKTVGLNGFEPDGSNAVQNAQKLFTEPVIEPDSQGLIYSEGNQDIAFSADSYALHQQALSISKQQGIEYVDALQQLFQ